MSDTIDKIAQDLEVKLRSTDSNFWSRAGAQAVQKLGWSEEDYLHVRKGDDEELEVEFYKVQAEIGREILLLTIRNMTSEAARDQRPWQERYQSYMEVELADPEDAAYIIGRVEKVLMMLPEHGERKVITDMLNNWHRADMDFMIGVMETLLKLYA